LLSISVSHKRLESAASLLRAVPRETFYAKYLAMFLLSFIYINCD